MFSFYRLLEDLEKAIAPEDQILPSPLLVPEIPPEKQEKEEKPRRKRKGKRYTRRAALARLTAFKRRRR